MNDNNMNNSLLLPPPDCRPVSRGTDLDDLIFQGEGWLASDR